MLKQILKDLPRTFSRCSWLLFLEVAILVLAGIAFIYGTGQQTGGRFATMWLKQLVWVVAGGGAMLVLIVIDYRKLERFWGLIYGGGVLLLILVLFSTPINGARSWFLVGPFSLQPSEFAKLALIIALAYYASRKSIRLEVLSHAVPVLLLALVPMALIALQPDLGSAMTIVPIALTVLLVGGLRKRWLVYATLAGLVLAIPIYHYGLAQHQRERLVNFMNPESDLQNSGWNAYQSMLAVGSGGMTGKGYMQGTQNTLGFLPRTVAPTDFIFSVIAEETGFIGSAIVIGTFAALICTAFFIASKAPDGFGKLIACSIAVLLSVHIYVNIGMTMGMAPIIGIPLPFVSYGGSFMIAMLSCVGILQSIYVRRASGWAADTTYR